MNKKTIYAIIVILIIAVGITIFALKPFSRQQKETGTATVAENKDNYLSYIHSIYDDENMALDGTHEFLRNPKDGYLYITSIKEHGLNVFDVSNPTTSQFISSFKDNNDNNEVLMKRGHDVRFFGDYALIGATGDNAIQILDISDPKNISAVSIIKDKEEEKSCLKGLHGMGINGNYLYIAGTGDNGLCVADISDPKNPRLVKNIFDNGELALGGPHSIHFMDNYLYVLGDEGLQVFDISRPTEPMPIAAFREGVKGGHDIEQKGIYVYTAAYQDGLSIFDVSNPAMPKRVSGIAPTEENGLSFVSDGDIIRNYWFVVSEKSHSLMMVDVSSPINPTIKEILRFDEEKMPFLYNGHTIKAIGNYLYVAGLQDGFGIMKFSER